MIDKKYSEFVSQESNGRREKAVENVSMLCPVREVVHLMNR